MMNKNYNILEIYNSYTDLQQEKLIELKELIMNVAVQERFFVSKER